MSTIANPHELAKAYWRATPDGRDEGFMRKDIELPSWALQYNYEKNSVDQADQRRANYELHRKHRRTWFSLWY